MSEPIPVTEKPAESGAGWASETKEFLKAVLWAVLIAVFLRSFVVEAYKIPSGSMLPTLEIGDHIFVNKFLYGFMVPFTTKKFLMWRDPVRGEVIVFKNPQDVSKDFIKRVIGEPGDVIDIRDNELYVNDVVVPTELIGPSTVNEDCQEREVQKFVEHLDSGIDHFKVHQPMRNFSGGPFVVPEGELFVMGDNRDNSQDSSRAHFTVPLENVKGRAMFVWLSWNSCGDWPTEKIRFERVGEGVR